MTLGGILARSQGLWVHGGGCRFMISSRSYSVTIPTNGCELLSR